MRRIHGITVPALAGLAALSGGCGQDRIRAEPQPVMGWSDGWYVTNGQVHLSVVPDVARVMALSAGLGWNVIWSDPSLHGASANFNERAWQNFGGAKVWVAPQSAWNWPPDPHVDRGPCVAQPGPAGTLRLLGQPSPGAGVRVDRVYRVLPDRPIIECTYTMTNTSDEPVEWALWSVLQLLGHGRALLPMAPGDRAWTGEADVPAPPAEDDIIAIDYADKQPKVFTVSGAGWAAYEVAGQVLVLTFGPARPDELPPGHGNAEFYTGEQYVELEHVGPRVRLEPGRSASMRERWHLYPLPLGEMSPAAMRAYIMTRLTEEDFVR